MVAVTLFFLTYKYSGKPGSLTDELEIDQPEPDIASLERLPAPVLSVERSPEDDHSGGTGGNPEKTPTVTIGMTDAGILLVADKASLQDVLDVLVGTTLVEFIDLRSESARLSEQAQDDTRSFRISGSLDEVLHVVMDQYNQSYVVSHSRRRGAQEIQVTKLFLHGASQDDNQLSGGGSGYRSGASDGVATEWDVSESGGLMSLTQAGVDRRRSISRMFYVNAPCPRVIGLRSFPPAVPASRVTPMLVGRCLRMQYRLLAGLRSRIRIR